MIESIEIFINSKYGLVAVIIAITSCAIQLIRAIWRVIKEQKIISIIKNENIEELLIDKKGTISIRKKLEKPSSKKTNTQPSP